MNITDPGRVFEERDHLRRENADLNLAVWSRDQRIIADARELEATRKVTDAACAYVEYRRQHRAAVGVEWLRMAEEDAARFAEFEEAVKEFEKSAFFQRPRCGSHAGPCDPAFSTEE
jgi:hypothetical protein